ncbi:DUF3772 domain-containing protein [Chelatococcus reniformis]|uniref:Mechanosensitive ion channel protein MscS n=1 Tax=Chelatococcus reniformis TaxID=1494448 RepID=A0A916UMI3_9HYPH|nr:DUF3772 domain-containing protein [Chelatococcus reniformis]GGC78827.1 mechanosensitive ion channel protein MscS [Chelatococcus reniformis]
MTGSSDRSLARLAAAAVRWLVALSIGAGIAGFAWQASAQAPPAPTPTTAPTMPDATADGLKTMRERFDHVKFRLNEAEAALARPGLTDAQLIDLRAQVDPATETIQDILNRLSPRVTAAKARLDQLGPKPEASAPPESPEAARDRQEREREFAELNEVVRAGNALLVQANQVSSHVTNRRRALFTNTLFHRNWSILSPDLWLSVMQSAPSDLKAISTITSDWLSALGSRVAQGRVLALLVAFAAALATYMGRRRLAPRLTARNDRITAPTRLRRALAAVWRTLFAALPAALSAYFIYMGLDGAGLLPPGIEPIIRAALIAILFIVFVRALAEAILAPGAPSWRVVDAPDSAAEPLYHLVVIGSVVLAIGRIIEVALQTIGAALATTIAAKGVVAIVVALLLARTLQRIRRNDDCDEASLGPYVPTEPTFGGPLRIIAWAVVAVLLVAVLGGFIALASFTIQQCIWIAVIGAALGLALTIVDETIGRTLAGDGRVAVALQTSVGLRKRSLDQLAVLTSGLLRVLLVAIALLLVLAPWGIDSDDFTSSLDAALFGLQIAGFRISLGTVIGAAGLFILAVLATRALQRWLSAKYLPVTGLDSGIRNSITTAVGYLGGFVAVALALAQLGLSLDKIAIVAGALSVGIGFGLQSIVNNFVSGLILLWERSISVGDWIVVGGEQGYVRRISVRATEIQTFERASVIVPNSNLVSGVVKNWLHNNRIGRISIVVTVPFQPDPNRVASLLLACAGAHPDVLQDPKPSALFNKFTDSSQEFELRCFADVEATLRIKSELNFRIFQRLTEEKIYSAPGVPLSEVKLQLPQQFEALMARRARAPRAAGKAEAGEAATGSATPDDERPDGEAPNGRD